jgi:cytochrome c biogenesis protein CcdA
LRSSLLNALIFGLGLVAAYIVMGCCVLLAGFSLGRFSPYLTAVAGLITIVAGVNLLGLIRLPISADNYVRVSVRKYSSTLIGLFILGMLFSIVKAPCAAPMVLILLSRILIDGAVQDLWLLLVFGAGVLTPFLGVTQKSNQTPNPIRISPLTVRIAFRCYRILLDEPYPPRSPTGGIGINRVG